METAPTTPIVQNNSADNTHRTPRTRPQRRRKPPNQNQSNESQQHQDRSPNSRPGDTAQDPSPSGDRAPQRQRRPPRQSRSQQSNEGSGSVSENHTSRPTSRSNNQLRNSQPPSSSTPDGNGPAERIQGSSRRAKFGSSLTQPSTETGESKSNDAKRPQKPRRDLPQGDDLASTLTRAISVPPYPDCPICFNSIRPEQAIWSCSPLLPIIVSDVQVHAQYCWTSFHIKCIRSWAEKNVKDVADAWRARGEPDKKGDWRCPGCQGKREIVPQGYQCFCGSMLEPKALRMSTPHSCGASCSRIRESGCGHPCPLRCHPGPCPPCQVTTQLPCYCPRQTTLTFRCGADSRGNKVPIGKERNLSCGQVCGRKLNCGLHLCEKICHAGNCGTCEAKEEGAKCFCGKETRGVVCGQGERLPCFVEGSDPWVGRFGCDGVCGRLFDCGVHECQKPCHVPSPTRVPCPRAPARITHCPCGRKTIASSPNTQPSPDSFPARTSCTEPIPTCSNPCSKIHAGCEHPCRAPCHEGPCPVCLEDIVRPCRCGGTTRRMPCYRVSEAGEGEVQEILCDKPCMALRACGKHQCRRACCPLASVAPPGGGGNVRKRKQHSQHQAAMEQSVGDDLVKKWHECDLVCGKMLNCGLHHCERKDHKGSCGQCLRSSFEEMICPCGRTVYEPPIPCGTVMQCHYPCPLPPPSSCPHPSTTPHSCHPEGTPCPPCAFLTIKLCACGKNQVPNVRCSLEREKISCGTVCGKLMSCGFHTCERLCHTEGECGACVAVCGKARRSCLPEHHPCPLPCHAPSSCIETTPCPTPIVLTCPCGRIKQSVQCGRTSSSAPMTGIASSSSSELSRGSSLTSPSYTHPATPKCSSECLIAKRNARLAEALGINPASNSGSGFTSAFSSHNVVYSDELVQFASANAKFLSLVERTFAEFVNGPSGAGQGTGETMRILPRMPFEKRKFVHDLANVYRIDTLMINQEPHRSVQLIRRIDSRIPSPLLSAFIASSTSAASLGKLRGLGSSSTGAWKSATALATTATKSITSISSSRGWAPVPVNRPAAASGSSGGVVESSPGALAVGQSLSRTASPLPRAVGVSTPSPAPPAPPVLPPPALVTEDVPENWDDDL